MKKIVLLYIYICNMCRRAFQILTVGVGVMLHIAFHGNLVRTKRVVHAFVCLKMGYTIPVENGMVFDMENDC